MGKETSYATQNCRLGEGDKIDGQSIYARSQKAKMTFPWPSWLFYGLPMYLKLLSSDSTRKIPTKTNIVKTSLIGK